MKGKKEYIILAAIIMAVVAYLSLRPTDRSTYELPELSELPKNEITKIEIITAQKSVTLNRKSDSWFVGPKEYPVDPDKIDRMLEILSKLTLTALVSESKSDPRYDLGPDKRIQVKAWANVDLKREFDVGKAADTFRHTFVKIAGDTRIFHAENSFRERFEITIASLRDKQVMAFKVDEIKSFKITKDGKTAEFKQETVKDDQNDTDKNKEKVSPPEKSEFKWIKDNSETADSNKVKSFLSALSDLKCKDFRDDGTKSDLNDPVIAIKLSGTKTYQLSVYAHGQEEDEALWPGQSSESNYPFLLADWKVKEVVKDSADLMPDKPKPEKKVEEK